LDSHATPVLNTSKREYEGGKLQELFASRVGAAAGAAGAVVYAVSAFTAGRPLSPDASVSKVVTHLSDNQVALLAGILLGVLSVGCSYGS
jgi:hypothetical protein